MARTLELDTLTEPSNSGTANITLSSNTTTTMPLVDINGGAIDGTTLGAGTPSSVAATTLTSTGNATFGDAIGDATTVTGTLAVAGATTLSGATTATTIAATTLTTSGAATFGNSADDATTVTGTLAVAEAATLSGNVSLGNTVLDAITVVGTTTINAGSGPAYAGGVVVGTVGGEQTINIASHDGADGGLGLAGTLVKASAAELNVLDGSLKNTSSITIADSDAFIVIDGNTTKQIPASDLETYLEAVLDTQPNLTTVGELVAGSLGTNFGNISIGSSTITTTGAVSTGALTATTADINGGTLAAITIDGAWTAASQTCANLGTVTTGAFTTITNLGNVTTTGTVGLGGKLTAGSNEIEGSNFDINGGTIDGCTITGNISGSAATVTGSNQTNITTAANLTTVGALVAGSLGTNFGNISIGSSTITTTGAISGGSLVTADLILNNTENMANEVDGTSGHWCVQEGDSDLFIINRVTNKKYKFKLEEIT